MKGIWAKEGVLKCVQCKTSMGWIGGRCTLEGASNKMQGLYQSNEQRKVVGP